MSPQKPLWTRRIAALLLPLFLGAYLLDAVHYTAVEHAPCPVDGVLAHVDDGHGHGHAPHATELEDDGDPSSSERASRIVPAPDDHEGHGHCSLLLLSREAVADGDGPALTGSAPELAAGSIPASTAAAGPRIPVFLLAPKNSPPRAG